MGKVISAVAVQKIISRRFCQPGSGGQGVSTELCTGNVDQMS